MSNGNIGLVLALLTSALLTSCSDATEPSLDGIDESFLDRSVSPCADFYQFACGTWIAEHPTTNGSVQRFFEGDTRTSYLLRRILEDDRAGTPYVPHPGSSELGAYYGACMTQRSAPFVEHAALDARIAEIQAASTSNDLATVVARLQADGVGAFFNFTVTTDPGNPTRRLATFYEGGMSLPDRRYYFDATMSVIPQYEEHVRRLAAVFPTPLGIDPAAVLSVETALAKGLDADDPSGDPLTTHNVLAFDAFTATSPQFPWTEYLRVAGFPPLGEVNLRRPAYLMRFDALWSSSSLAEKKSYLLWRVLEAYAESMGQSSIAEEARFHYGVFQGHTTAAPDWWACQQSTEWALGFALSHPYVDIVFDSEEKRASTDLVASIKGAFRQELGSRGWIDAPTRQEAEKKLDQILDKVGGPDVWPSLPPVAFTSSFQGNLLAMNRWSRSRTIELLAEPVNRASWTVAPCTTNAFYSPSRNEIVFPAAILQTPFFALGRAHAINYGAIGSIVGHELTHGFDDDGRKFDGEGKLRNWWTPSTDEEFIRRSQCVTDQYAAYEVLPGVHVDGQLTLGENIADIGGLKLAYAAYKARGANESFSGAFGADAQFFLAYAQTECANMREEIARSRVRTDPHAPPRFRVNGVVRNMPEFAKAFGCAAGTPMAPPDRCDVW